MKRAWVVLIAGLLLAGAAYLCSYSAGRVSSHRLEGSGTPELAWLKEEFHLSDAEFSRIRQMHQGYLAGCAARCRHIDAKNVELRTLLAASNKVTPEIEKALAESARLRTDCQRQMLEHFYQVSQTMPPEQGKRYLAWVQGQTILSDTHSQMQQSENRHGEMHHH